MPTWANVQPGSQSTLERSNVKYRPRATNVNTFCEESVKWLAVSGWRTARGLSVSGTGRVIRAALAGMLNRAHGHALASPVEQPLLL